jgi:hypothetical protein
MRPGAATLNEQSNDEQPNYEYRSKDNLGFHYDGKSRPGSAQTESALER